MTAVGAYVGNEPDHVLEFESWLGRKAELVHGVVGGKHWKDFTTSASWMIDTLWKDTQREFLWSVPLIVDDGKASLAAASKGSYNDYYRSVAQTLLRGTDGDGAIHIRTGWEFNGDWFPWSAAGRAEEFKGAFRQFVDTFREVSDRFVFEWNVNHAWGGLDPASAYPGDDYVDVIGMDFYWNKQWDSKNPVQAFNNMVNSPYGLAWLEKFAAEHGKPTAYSEWGVPNDAEGGPYVQLAREWFDSHDVLYQLYWDSDAAYAGRLSGTKVTATASAFVDQFGHTDGSEVDSSLPESAAYRHMFSSRPGPDTIRGSAENDRITGGGGDTLVGGSGDDTYVVRKGDTIVEVKGGGIDTARVWIDGFVLPDNVENLVIEGGASWSGSGNALDNRIWGNSGANVLDGRSGNDVLWGGRGNDTFVIGKGMGSDTILDFGAGGDADVLRLDGFSFRDAASVRAASVQRGQDTVIHLDGVHLLTVKGFRLDELRDEDLSLVNIQSAAPRPQAPAAPPTGVSARQTFSGTARAETIVGTSGHDAITGGGNDTLVGGTGDDTYSLTPGDVVVERANGGIDTVKTWVGGYVLPDHVENLVLTGTKGISGFGNALDNRIKGNGAGNLLDGGAGNDFLTGGGGSDTFVIEKGMGNDTITDFKPADGDVVQLKGFAFRDFAGIQAASTQVGSDLVISLGQDQSLWMLGVKLSSLDAGDFQLVGTASPPSPPVPQPPAPVPPLVGGTGTGRTVNGTSGHDTLTGTGGDILVGGGGNDTYDVTPGDKVVELPGGGTDTIKTWIERYVLPDNVENLQLTGTKAVYGFGNAMNNRLVGNSADNVLDGGAGNDILSGRGGNDTFVVARGMGHDTITDFEGAGRAGGDILRLVGFGAGATILNHHADTFAIQSRDGHTDFVTLTGVSSLYAGDYVFG